MYISYYIKWVTTFWTYSNDQVHRTDVILTLDIESKFDNSSESPSFTSPAFSTYCIMHIYVLQNRFTSTGLNRFISPESPTIVLFTCMCYKTGSVKPA